MYTLEERFILNEDTDSEDIEDADLILDDQDWGTQYAEVVKTKDKTKVEAFWKKYFTEEWGKDAEDVKNLRSYFMNTLLDRGWEAKLNPYIEYVENIINNKSGNGLSLKDIAPMRVQIEAVKKQPALIGDADLRGRGKLGFHNLIFKKSFYKVSYNDQLEYLKLQHALLEKSAVVENLVQTFANIFLLSGDIKNYSKNIQPSEDAVLRDLRSVKVHVEKVIGKKIGEPEAVTDKTITKILEKLPDKARAKLALSYLYDIASIWYPEALAAVEKESGKALASIKDSTPIKAEDSAKFKSIFGFTSHKYDSKHMLLLLTKLLEVVKS
jgi:hypothetical protein